MDVNFVIQRVLQKIVPSEKEKREVYEFANKVLEIVKNISKEFNAKPMLVGSITRDTWLPGKKEIDIFILFPKGVERKELEEKGLEIGKRTAQNLNAKFVIEYAEHPYVRIFLNEFSADIVPCYEIQKGEKIISAVDRSPLHVKYLEKKLKKEQSNEVRLLKQFLKANNLYGADSKVEGFSGYLSELLIIAYGSFINLLKNAVEWQPGTIIDLENYYEKSEYKELVKKFKNQPLIVIDPVDKNRNVAAALSCYNFYKFKKLAKEFLEDPCETFFFGFEKEPIKESELIKLLLKRRTELFVIRFSCPKVVPDILYPQLRALARRVEKILEQYNFKVLNKGVYSDEKEFAYLVLEMEVSKLPKIEKKIGPPIFVLKNSRDFLSKYKDIALNGPWIEECRWVVEISRKFTTAKEKLIDIFDESEEELKAKGIPNYLAKEISKSFEIIDETSKIMEIVEKDENFGIFLKQFFEKERLV